MRVIENAKKEFMKHTEDARKETKYNPMHAEVIKNIIENGESFTREKWDSIYKSKETPWRADKLMQEVMVRTKGFPDDLCEKILSCAFNKRIYKAALSREDISLKNIEIALAGISERELTKALQAKELSDRVVNQIAKRAINRLMYDPERIPDKYEMYALEQMTDKDAAQSYFSELEFGEVGEKILTIFANNHKLEEVRDEAFNLGCNPEKITAPYTEYMENIIIEGAMYAYFDTSSSYSAKQDAKELIMNAIAKNQISESMEKKIIDEFVSESKSKYYGDNEILATLLSNTKSVAVMEEGLKSFPSFASELIFKNPHAPHSLVEAQLNDELVKMFKMSLNTKSKIKLFDTYKHGLQEKLDGPWRDVELSKKYYDTITKPDSGLNASKAEVIATIASTNGTPEVYLDKILAYSLPAPDAQQVDSISVFKLNALMNKTLKKHDLPTYMVGDHPVSEFMRHLDTAVKYGTKDNLDALRGATIRLASNVSFFEHKDAYLEAFREVRAEFSKYQVPACPAQKQTTERIENLLEAVTNEAEKLSEIISAINKKPEECNRTEIEIAKNLVLNSSTDVARQDPVAFILGFEEAMNEYVKLSQREHQLDIEEGKIAPDATIEHVLSDEIVMMENTKTTTSAPATRTAPVIEDIEL